ncbi:MAG: hypothetical protein ACJ72N_01510 [Labedaea sp.]
MVGVQAGSFSLAWGARLPRNVLVCVAWSAQTGDAVAIKRILGGARREPARNRELQIALKLSRHPPPHLLAPLTWLVDDDDLLLVMPLAERSLADELLGHPLYEAATFPKVRPIDLTLQALPLILENLGTNAGPAPPAPLVR